MKGLEFTSSSLCIDIIPDRSASVHDGLLENIQHRPPQSAHLSLTQSISRTERANTGLKQYLIGVDIAHSRKKILVEKEALQSGSPGGEQRLEMLAIKI